MKPFIRVDDRLIHGQVVVGWGSELNPDYIILSDDEIASDETESELYLLGVPFEFEGKVLNFSETVKFLENNDHKNSIIVVKSPRSVLDLINLGLKVDTLNIGGMHSKENKLEINHYVYINRSEYDDLLLLKEEGINIQIQDLPGERMFNMKYLMEQWEKHEKQN
ncbi:MAG: PTS sugar transporter subunit IIB [Candidatus Delongbacteria bacterium]|nr:PTS sugar transporter subunit IIB [Candidatus Delongbacteria bacterium]